MSVERTGDGRPRGARARGRRDVALPSRAAANALARGEAAGGLRGETRDEARDEAGGEARDAGPRPGLPALRSPDGAGEAAPRKVSLADVPTGRAARRRAPARLAGERGDAEFLPSTLLLVDEPPSPVRRLTVLLLSALLATVLAWSWFGRIASYATAPGKVQAVGRTKVLEALASGQVVAILKRDGDRVAAGDVVLELDPADAVAARDIVVQQRADLTGQNDRRRAEVAAARADPVPQDPPVAWGEGVPQRVREREGEVMRADLARLAGTLATLASRRTAAAADVKKYADMITAQTALVAVTSESSTMADGLQKSGWNSRAKALDLIESLREQQVSLTSFQGKLADAKAAVATLDSQAAKARESFVSDDTDALTAAERRLAEVDQQLVKVERTVSQATVRAPVGGVIHASAVTTLGQFVRPAQQLMQIVPERGDIEVVAFLDNADIGLVRTGQDAAVKVDSFNYATYGMVDATVEAVGGDALPMTGKATLQSATLDGSSGQTTAAQRTGNLKFQVTVHPKDPTISVDGHAVPLTPGMSVTVEIETENRRLIDYVATPILELFSTAAHER